MEGGSTLVKIRRFLDIVRFHFTGRNITVVKTHSSVCILLIINVVIIQECLWLHQVCITETLVAVQLILVSLDATGEYQLKHIGEQVHLVAQWFHRIIQRRIGIIVEIQLAIDITSPYHILIHGSSSRKHDLCTSRHVVGIRLLLSLLLCLAARFRLSADSQRNTCKHQKHKYLFHHIDFIYFDHYIMHSGKFSIPPGMNLLSRFAFFLFQTLSYLTITSIAAERLRVMPSGPTALI